MIEIAQFFTGAAGAVFYFTDVGVPVILVALGDRSPMYLCCS